MLIVYIFIIFLVGASFGSFLNVLIDRLPRGESVFRGRSKCESCHKDLAARDLIPIISYFALSGRCRYCHTKIPKRLPIVEIGSASIASALFLYSINTNLPPILPVLLFVIILSFLGIFFTDLAYGIIPDELTIAIIISAIPLLILSKPNLLPQHFLVGIISLLLFLGLYVLTHGRGMGAGDVKLAGAIGFFLGFPKIIIGFYVAFLTAMIVSIILILMSRKKLKGDTIAFGPFLSIGAVAGYFLGIRILDLFL